MDAAHQLAEDRVFDSLPLVGPRFIGLVAVLDRSVATAYITVFVLYTLHRAIGG